MPAVNMIIENATLLNTAGKYCDKDIVVVPVVQPDNVRVTLEITLKAAEWVDNKQIVESATITEDSTLVVSHTMADVQAYLDSGIMLASAEVGKMEFTCVVVPTEDIKVLVHIVDPLITTGGAEVLRFNSVEEMNASEAKDGSIALVPSEDTQSEGRPQLVLSDYSYGGLYETFLQVVLFLYGSGGGTEATNHNHLFWEDLTKNADVDFVVDTSLVEPGTVLTVPSNSVIRKNGVVIGIDFSFAMINSAGMQIVNVAFSDPRNGVTVISVTVN